MVVAHATQQPGRKKRSRKAYIWTTTGWGGEKYITAMKAAGLGGNNNEVRAERTRRPDEQSELSHTFATING